MRRNRAQSFSWSSMLVLVAASCGPSASDDGSSTASASGGTTSSTAAGDASVSATAVAPTSDPASTDDTTLGDDTSLTDTSLTDTAGTQGGTETGEADCEDPQDVTATFTVSPDETLSETCTVLGVSGDAAQSVITLACSGMAVTLTVETTPPSRMPSVAVDQLVRLEHVVEPIFWNNRWFALFTAGGESDSLLVGGVSSSVLDPPGTTLDAFFGRGSFAAPTVTAVDGLCTPVDDDFCGPLERLALDFTLVDFGATRVLDHGTGFVDVLAFGWAYTVEHAMRYPGPLECDDAPEAWLDFVMVWFPSD